MLEVGAQRRISLRLWQPMQELVLIFDQIKMVQNVKEMNLKKKKICPSGIRTRVPRLQAQYSNQ